MADLLGAITISKPAGHESGQGAVAGIHLYGPRGGNAGKVYIGADEARDARDRLTKMLGEPAGVFVHIWDDNANLYATRDAALIGIGDAGLTLYVALDYAQTHPGEPAYIDDGMSCVRFMSISTEA